MSLLGILDITSPKQRSVGDYIPKSVGWCETLGHLPTPEEYMGKTHWLANLFSINLWGRSSGFPIRISSEQIPQGFLQQILWKPSQWKWCSRIWLVVLGHPSEKYEFVNWDNEIPNINGKIKSMATKPPTRYRMKDIQRGLKLRGLKLCGWNMDGDFTGIQQTTWECSGIFLAEFKGPANFS